jgi:hypothetical protein
MIYIIMSRRRYQDFRNVISSVRYLSLMYLFFVLLAIHLSRNSRHRMQGLLWVRVYIGVVSKVESYRSVFDRYELDIFEHIHGTSK